MSVPANLASWSAIESQNYPQDSDTAGGVIDNICRQIQATTRRYTAFLGTPQAGSALNLSTADGSIIEVTGSGGTISTLGTVSAGMKFTLRMQGSHTFVHSSNLVCPGAASILTAAGDILEWTSAGSGVWWLTDFQPGQTSVGGLPVGTISVYAGIAAPSGWLFCNGAAISRSAFAGLFAVIGTTYGAGDGSTTFNVPDLRGRVPFGLDTMGTSAAGRVTSAGSGINGASLGASGGAQNVTLDTTMIPAHAHTQQGSFVSGNQSADHVHTVSGTTGIDSPDHTHQYSGPGLSSLQGGSNSVTVFSGGNATTSGASQNHTHSFSAISTPQSANHTHQTSISGNTTPTGGGAAHNNMPPALMVNFIIRT